MYVIRWLFTFGAYDVSRSASFTPLQAFSQSARRVWNLKGSDPATLRTEYEPRTSPRHGTQNQTQKSKSTSETSRL